VPNNDRIKIRRVLITVSDKAGVGELARAFHAHGAEVVATGRTAVVIQEAGVPITPIEKISGSPEAFQGRMKTLSFPVCSGILYRRGDAQDERDLKDLKIQPIDAVVVNFYPFDQTQAIEEIDIGGPTLVRSAAKNAPSTVVVTNPAQYPELQKQLRDGGVLASTSQRLAAEAWDLVSRYDDSISAIYGAEKKTVARVPLRYGENPHQKGWLEVGDNPPIDWPTSRETQLTTTEISYNNVLDVTAGYGLISDVREISPKQNGVVIIKHNNPCGVATAPTQLEALERAWAGDPVSAFGGVVLFTHALEVATAQWLRDRFVELIAAPDLGKDSATLKTILEKRKNLKALSIKRFGEMPLQTSVAIPGGVLGQTGDAQLTEFADASSPLKSVTATDFSPDDRGLARFGVAITRALKSNAITLVRSFRSGSETCFQLVGAGQGQPNRIEALRDLAVPRAYRVLDATGGKLSDCIMISDAFFPFRDTVDTAHAAGIRKIIQPGGSIKDQESIQACNEHGMAMAFTGIRHFRH